MRRTFVLVTLLALLASVAALFGETGSSTAAFTTTSQSTITATAARVSGWLHLSSQGSSETGFADQVANTTPAASGQDTGIGVYFDINTNGVYPHYKVLKVWTPSAFPDVSPDPAVTAVNVTVTLLPDPTTGLQPISKYGVDVWNAAPPTYTKTITGWGTNVQRQLNLQTKFPGKKYGPGLYVPSVVITVTYTGFTTTYYQYTIPIRIQYR